MTVKIEKDIEQIRQSAEAMDAAKPERIGSPSIGDCIRQGDVFLVCLPALLDGRPAQSTQLAPGDSQGSRHIMTGECVVVEVADKNKLREAIKKATGAAVPVELIGPMVQCKGESTLTHPQHGHKILPEGTTWAVTYQRAYGEEVRRVLD